MANGVILSLSRASWQAKLILALACCALFVRPALGAVEVQGQPIIDMHLHGMFWTGPDGTALSRMCFPEPCAHAKALVDKAAHLLPQTLEVMKQYNVVLGVVSDQFPDVLKWKRADPQRFLLGVFVGDRGWGRPTRPHDWREVAAQLRPRFIAGELQVLGELAVQYDNVAVDDSSLDPLFAMAEELDVPVQIHLAGLGGTPDFPIHLGDPLRLSTVLRKHSRLRIYLENAGWPFLEQITSLMYTYPNVYADLSTITWILPRQTFYAYLRALVQNGLSKRLMFGSDQMMWPETIPLAIKAIENADFLSAEQKRDIFYNNAARFLRLTREEISAHHRH